MHFQRFLGLCSSSPLVPCVYDVQVVMATNRIDILDPALLRPGRIDRKIEFPHPTLTSRMDIMGIHSRKMNLLRGIDLKVIAEKMPSASGAECKVRRHLTWLQDPVPPVKWHQSRLTFRDFLLSP